MTIRPARVSDLDAIAAIQDQSPEASHWPPDQYLAYTVLIAENESHCNGFIVTRELAPGEYEILNLAVRNEARRTGAGRALAHSAMAGRPGAWYLEVRESNAVALEFYKSLGFEVAGRRPKYYTDPEEAAIVMRICS